MVSGKQGNHALVLFLNHAELILNYFKKQKVVLSGFDMAMEFESKQNLPKFDLFKYQVRS